MSLYSLVDPRDERSTLLATIRVSTMLRVHNAAEPMRSMVARIAAGESDAPDEGYIGVKMMSHDVSRPEPE